MPNPRWDNIRKMHKRVVQNDEINENFQLVTWCDLMLLIVILGFSKVNREKKIKQLNGQSISKENHSSSPGHRRYIAKICY